MEATPRTKSGTKSAGTQPCVRTEPRWRHLYIRSVARTCNACQLAETQKGLGLRSWFWSTLTNYQLVTSGVRVGGGGGPRRLFPTPKKVRGCQILNIVIVVRLVIKNLEESDRLVVVNIKNLTFFYRLKLWISLTFCQSGMQGVWPFNGQVCRVWLLSGLKTYLFSRLKSVLWLFSSQECFLVVKNVKSLTFQWSRI